MRDKKMFRKAALAGIAAALIGGAAFFFVAKAGYSADAQEGAPPAQMQGMPLPAVVIKKEPVRIWRSFSGRLSAVDFVELRPQVSGRIEEIRFEDGSHVEKGDILFVVDPRPYEANAEKAQAALAAAKSAYDLAKKELKRGEDLIKTESISQSALDKRRNEAVLAKNALDGAQALVTEAQIDLDHAYLKAPVSGRVSRAEVTEGNLVQAGPNAPVLTTIVSDSGIYADFEVDEKTYIGSIRQKTEGNDSETSLPVEIALSDGSVYEGALKSFDNHINSSTGTIRARAYFDNRDGALVPGMYVGVRLGSASAEDAILLAEKAIGTDQDRKFVYVVGDDGLAAYREVTPGDSIGDRRIIVNGLSTGDKVVTDGIMKIRPGVPVAPQFAEAGTPPETKALPPAEAKTETPVSAGDAHE